MPSLLSAWRPSFSLSLLPTAGSKSFWRAISSGEESFGIKGELEASRRLEKTLTDPLPARRLTESQIRDLKVFIGPLERLSHSGRDYQLKSIVPMPPPSSWGAPHRWPSDQNLVVGDYQPIDAVQARARVRNYALALAKLYWMPHKEYILVYQLLLFSQPTARSRCWESVEPSARARVEALQRLSENHRHVLHMELASQLCAYPFAEPEDEEFDCCRTLLSLRDLSAELWHAKEQLRVCLFGLPPQQAIGSTAAAKLGTFVEAAQKIDELLHQEPNPTPVIWGRWTTVGAELEQAIKDAKKAASAAEAERVLLKSVFDFVLLWDAWRRDKSRDSGRVE